MLQSFMRSPQLQLTALLGFQLFVIELYCSGNTSMLLADLKKGSHALFPAK